MTVHSYKFGAGKLILGSAHLDVSPQMTSVLVKWSEKVDTIDAIPVLSGEEIPEEESATYSATIGGTFLQDLALGGVVDWTWLHMGETVDFRFEPDIPTARGCEGTCRVIPLDLGGDITKPRSRPTSDFTWNCIGIPIFGVADATTAAVTEDS